MLRAADARRMSPRVTHVYGTQTPGFRPSHSARHTNINEEPTNGWWTTPRMGTPFGAAQKD
eukprot:107300-Amorphochlora_amoeboformis.AAC.1